MTRRHPISLGELITLFYHEYLIQYGNADLASVATSATINEMLADHAFTGTVATA